MSFGIKHIPVPLPLTIHTTGPEKKEREIKRYIYLFDLIGGRDLTMEHKNKAEPAT